MNLKHSCLGLMILLCLSGLPCSSSHHVMSLFLCLLGDFQPIKLTPTLLSRLKYLMDVIEKSDGKLIIIGQWIIFFSHISGLSTEGIFRKTGNITQQRAIVDALLNSDFDSATFAWQEYSGHELAGALKSIISHLDQPLLTHGLTPCYLQAASKSHCSVKFSTQCKRLWWWWDELDVHYE